MKKETYDAVMEEQKRMIADIKNKICPLCGGAGYYGKCPVRVCPDCLKKRGEEQYE